jgi:hypothetical protein
MPEAPSGQFAYGCGSDRTQSGLEDSDGMCLLGPEESKFDSFRQSLCGKLRRLTIGCDRLDNVRSQKRQPQQSSDVTRSNAFALREFGNRLLPTASSSSDH